MGTRADDDAADAEHEAQPRSLKAAKTPTLPYGAARTDSESASESEPGCEDPADKFGRFGAHEIPVDLRQQLIGTELRRVDPERFQNTQPPNGALGIPEEPQSPGPIAHSPKMPPVALNLPHEKKVIVAAQPTILSSRNKANQPNKDLPRSLDPEALTLPSARAEERKARSRKLVISALLGAALLLALMAIALWPTTPELDAAAPAETATQGASASSATTNPTVTSSPPPTVDTPKTAAPPTAPTANTPAPRPTTRSEAPPTKASPGLEAKTAPPPAQPAPASSAPKTGAAPRTTPNLREFRPED